MRDRNQKNAYYQLKKLLERLTYFGFELLNGVHTRMKKQRNTRLSLNLDVRTIH